MKIYISERQIGKTTMLVKQSAESGAIIVAPTCAMCKHIELIAHDLSLKIPTPITVAKFIKNLASGGLGQTQKYLIDELQMILHSINVDIATVDINSTEVLYLDKGEKKHGKTGHSR